MASTHDITLRTALFLERFHHVKGMYPVIYMSNSNGSANSSHALDIQIVQRM